jgi:hypothetical protein
MITKRLLVIVALTMMFLISAHPVYAAGAGSVYVDTAWTGGEDGTQSHPYNTLQEGVAFAQAQAGGAWIYTKQTDGTWLKYRYIPPAIPGATGIPLANIAIYALLAVLALALILVGWQFQRRSRQLNA